MKIVFATQNQDKLAEIKAGVSENIEIIGLRDLSFFDEIPETNPTIEGNARQKSQFIFDRFNLTCFADDTGLEIEVLNGEPGVYSARYAGEKVTYQDNVNKVLENMKNKEHRKACFRTIISFIHNGKEVQFEGQIKGIIANSAQGNKGFGYDPIFIPEGENRTFAEMSMDEKNKISHRGQAVQKLLKYLKEHFPTSE